MDPYERTEIFAKAAGYVERVLVDIGDHVAKDQVLAELWIPEMRQEHEQKKSLLDEAKAKVGQANAARQAAQAMIQAAEAKREEAQSLLARYEAEIAYRKSEYGRLQRLLSDRAVQKDQVDEKLSQLQAAHATLASAEAVVRTAEANVRVEQAKLAQAESDLVAAQSRVAVTEADLKQTEILLAYGTIKAPYEGMITSRRVDTGAFIQSAAAGRTEPLFSFVRTDRLRIVANVPETDAAWVQVGQPALLEVNAIKGRQFPGKVTSGLSGSEDVVTDGRNLVHEGQAVEIME